MLILRIIGFGILIGLSAAVPIGPINVEIARRTLRGGFRFGVAIGGGAATVDMTYAISAALGWRPLIDRPYVSTVLTIAGAALLVYLAAQCFRGFFQALRSRRDGEQTTDRFTPDPNQVATTKFRTTYLTGLVMTVLNPMTLAFWFLVLPGLAAKLTQDAARDLPFLCIGVFIGAFGWAVAFSAVLALLGRFKRNLWTLAADAVGGLMLLAFALIALARLLVTR